MLCKIFTHRMQLARTPKPTGHAEVPWWIEEAWTIDREINGCAHVRTLGDDDGIDGVDEAPGQDDNDIIEIFDTDEEEALVIKPDPGAPSSKRAKTTIPGMFEIGRFC